MLRHAKHEARAVPEIKKTLCKFFLAGACDRGDLCTWAHGKEQLGEPIGDIFEEDDLNLAEEFPEEFGEVDAAELSEEDYLILSKQLALPGHPGNVKRTICKFWQQGTCNRGSDCTFAHGSEDMQDMSANGEADYLEPVHAGGTKRTICKFWEEDACTKGDLCTFAHGPEEIGARILVEPLPFCREIPSHTGGYGLAPIGGSTGSTPMVKRTICKFWEQGTCTRGAECTWAHGEEDRGAVFEEEMSPSPHRHAAPRYVPAGPRSGQGGGKSLYGAASVFEAPKRKGLESHDIASPSGLYAGKCGEQLLKRTMCKFWLEGQCSRGESCTWAHGVEDKTVPVHQALGLKPSIYPNQSPPGPAEVRRTICKFWQQGKCTQAAGQCTWAHGEWEIGTPVGTVSNGRGYQGGSVFKRLRFT